VNGTVAGNTATESGVNGFFFNNVNASGTVTDNVANINDNRGYIGTNNGGTLNNNTGTGNTNGGDTFP